MFQGTCWSKVMFYWFVSGRTSPCGERLANCGGVAGKRKKWVRKAYKQCDQSSTLVPIWNFTGALFDLESGCLSYKYCYYWAVKIDLGYWPTKADKLSPLLWSQRQKKRPRAICGAVLAMKGESKLIFTYRWSKREYLKNMWTKSIEDNNEEQTLWLQTEIVKTKTTTIEDRNEWRCLSFLCLFRLACYWHVLSNIYGWSETSHWEMM